MGKGDRRNSNKMLQRRSRAGFKARMARRAAGGDKNKTAAPAPAPPKEEPKAEEAPAEPAAEEATAEGKDAESGQAAEASE